MDNFKMLKKSFSLWNSGDKYFSVFLKLQTNDVSRWEVKSETLSLKDSYAIRVLKYRLTCRPTLT